jgi:uncharacterized Zn-finger protein
LSELKEKFEWFKVKGNLNFDDFPIQTSRGTFRIICSSKKRIIVERIKIDFKTPKEKYHERNIVCPYCGDENTDSWEADDSDDESKCPTCGGIFSYERITDVSYSSTPVEAGKIKIVQEIKEDL